MIGKSQDVEYSTGSRVSGIVTAISNVRRVVDWGGGENELLLGEIKGKLSGKTM